MSNLKALVISGSSVKTFNSNNVWVDTGLTKDSLTNDNFTTYGFDPDILSTSLTSIYVNFINNGALGADGQTLWISEDIDKNLGVTAVNYVDSDTQPKLNLTVPAYLPKDSLTSTDQIWVYTTDTTYTPQIISTSFGASTTHDTAVSLTIVPRYIYNKPIIYRITVGTNVSSWSASQNPYQNIVTSIPASYLSLGSNDVKIEIEDAADATKISSTTISNAITRVDNTPTITIINADSNSYQVHFIIGDADSNDTAQYKLTLNNSKGSKVLVDWTTLHAVPIEVTYQFDSSDIVPNASNILNIDYKDNYGASSSTMYTFTGQYKNILFIDENGSYYSTDKGISLKLLDLGKIIGGRTSPIKKISLENDNPYSISSITINKTYTNAVVGAYLEFSKSDNPFTALDSLDFGTQVLNYKDSIDFYVRMRTDDTAIGIDNFTIKAIALPTS